MCMFCATCPRNDHLQILFLLDGYIRQHKSVINCIKNRSNPKLTESSSLEDRRVGLSSSDSSSEESVFFLFFFPNFITIFLYGEDT